MAAVTSPSFVALFTCFWFLVQTHGQQQITVKTGDDVTLQCLDPRGGDIELLVWTRQDLEEDVFVWKHGNMCEDYQHESFKNRVELRDSQMKDGDVTVILKNVNIKDTGTYECHVRNNDKPTAPQLITNINLTVINSGAVVGGGDKDGHVGLLISLSAAAVVVVVTVAVGFLIYRKRKRLSEPMFCKPPVVKADQVLLL
ncbi:hypothetical protein Q5P01_003020 [Channa striata]|uniref:Ig-like domain-containing protein n=1 Tax=Channa striata TaxID=64152 RepID=A0AA88NRI7_CHASR|nr:hypothetical protein Q5P01_003020 [Channa striata]